MKAGLSIAAALVATMMATLAAWQERPEYYVIGYSSSRKVGQAWDYREITLKLTNPAYKDARIFARRGYIARR